MELSNEIIAGVSINNVTGITGKSYELRDLMRAAREAESMGFDGVWVHDGMTGRRTTAAYDPTAVLTAVAAQTERIRLCTGILIPHIRNPVHFAQEWATLYEVSEGRAILGAGAGGGKGTIHRRQYGSLAAVRHGTDMDPALLYRRRARIFRDSLDVVRRLWSEDKVSYDGEFHKFDEITLGHARPATMPPILVAAGMYIPKEGAGAHIAVWNEDIAGTFHVGPIAQRSVVDHGEGWLTNHCTPDELAATAEDIEAIGEAEYPGRTYARALNCFMNVDDDPKKAWQGVKDHLTDFHGPPVHDDLVDRWNAAGTGEQVAAKINEFIDKGVTIFQFVVASSDQFGMMKRIAEEVLPRLKRAE